MRRTRAQIAILKFRQAQARATAKKRRDDANLQAEILRKPEGPKYPVRRIIP